MIMDLIREFLPYFIAGAVLSAVVDCYKHFKAKKKVQKRKTND